MESWEDLVAQGKKGPGSSNDKANDVLRKALEKEEPSDAPPPRPGGIQLKDGSLDISNYAQQERDANPMFVKGDTLLGNKEVAAFATQNAPEKALPDPMVGSSTEKPSPKGTPKAGTTKTTIKTTPEPEAKKLANMTYEEKLKHFEIEEGKARDILDSLFSDRGFYEEHFKVLKKKYTLRTSRGEPLSYIFSKLSGYPKMSKDGFSVTDEYIHHKNMYLLSIMLVSYEGEYFLNDDGEKDQSNIEKTRKFLGKLPEIIYSKMIDQMIDFDTVIKLVASSGCESFF